MTIAQWMGAASLVIAIAPVVMMVVLLRRPATGPDAE